METLHTANEILTVSLQGYNELLEALRNNGKYCISETAE
jgi:hypothetical protein